MNTPSHEKVELMKAETMRHILTVRSLMAGCGQYLIQAGTLHDRSKLESPEAEMFAEVTERLSGLTYGSPEYYECLEEMKKGALGHHYDHNRHHPEHHSEGVRDMTLFDLLEMLCDWKAATLRHKDGDMQKSVEHNADRFNIPLPIVRILANTVRLIDVISLDHRLELSYPHVKEG